MRKKLNWLLMLGLIFVGSVKAAEAAPGFTWSPSSGSYTTDSTFSVTLMIDSGTEKVLGADVVGSFDEDLLELTSVTAAGTKAFNFDSTSLTPIISNTAGTFEMTLSPTSMSAYDAAVASGSLLVFNFKAKAAGTATVSLTCQAGSLVESNIINDASSDVIDCASNGTGTYTITGASAATATPTTAAGATATPTSGSLPQTGAIGSTIGLVVFGTLSVLGAMLLRWL